MGHLDENEEIRGKMENGKDIDRSTVKKRGEEAM